MSENLTMPEGKAGGGVGGWWPGSSPLPAGFEWLQACCVLVCGFFVGSPLVADAVCEADVLAVDVGAAFGDGDYLVCFGAHGVEYAACACWFGAGFGVLAGCEADGFVYGFKAEPAVGFFAYDAGPDLVALVSLCSAGVDLRNQMPTPSRTGLSVAMLGCGVSC